VLLTHRKLLQSKATAIENDLRATLRRSTRIKELVENLPDLAVLVEPLPHCPAGSSRATRHPASPLAIVRDDDVCRPASGTPRPSEQYLD